MILLSISPGTGTLERSYSKLTKTCYKDCACISAETLELLHLLCTLQIKNDDDAGLSMNILCVGNKSLVQRGFFKNSTGDLLPVLKFLGGLYNFCNFVIVFSLIKS